jgi:hypothetical protein
VNSPEHAPHTRCETPARSPRFSDRCSDLMRELLDSLAAAPDRQVSCPGIATFSSSRPELPIYAPADFLSVLDR